MPIEIEVPAGSNAEDVVQPPHSFQPPPAPAPAGGAQSQGGQQAAQPQQQAGGAQAQKPGHPDLITRYNLTSKVSAQGDADAAAGASTSGSRPQPKAWSQNKVERQQLLQRRREQMILEARKKLEAQQTADARGAAPGGVTLGQGADLGARERRA